MAAVAAPRTGILSFGSTSASGGLGLGSPIGWCAQTGGLAQFHRPSIQSSQRRVVARCDQQRSPPREVARANLTESASTCASRCGTRGQRM